MGDGGELHGLLDEPAAAARVVVVLFVALRAAVDAARHRLDRGPVVAAPEPGAEAAEGARGRPPRAGAHLAEHARAAEAAEADAQRDDDAHADGVPLAGEHKVAEELVESVVVEEGDDLVVVAATERGRVHRRGCQRGQWCWTLR